MNAIGTINPMIFIVTSLVLAIIPMVVGIGTSYIKVSIVIGLLKNSLGLQQVPGVLAEFALSFSITILVMAPVIEEVTREIDVAALSAGLSNPQSTTVSQLSKYLLPWQKFLLKHSGKAERALFSEARSQKNNGDKESHDQSSKDESVVPSIIVVLPAFVLTELKEAFLMSLALMVPFVVIDLIVAQLLTGLGMIMMSPVLLSLPVKLFLFVVGDGWLLLAEALLRSYDGKGL